MNSYYYIKCTKFEFDADDYYVCMGGNIRKTPTTLKIFNSIEDAIDWKYNELDEDAFRSMFNGYEMTIEKL